MILTFCLQTFIFAEKLPVKIYTSNDGLASSAVTDVFRDSRGFLWFPTRDGLSRFDGREFINYSLSENPTALTFWTVLETRNGDFWISTSEGLYRIKPNQNPQIQPVTYDYKENEPLRLNAEKISNIQPTALFEDSEGRLWAGAGDAFLISDKENIVLQKIDLGEMARGNRSIPNVVSITETKDQSIWFATIKGVVRRLPNRKMIFYPIAETSDYEGSHIIRADREGRIWVVHGRGLFIFVPEQINEIADLPDFASPPMTLHDQMLGVSGKITLPEQSGKLFRFNPAHSEKTKVSAINGVFQSSDGIIWITTREDLFIVNGENYQRLHDTSGMPAWTGRIAEDLNGDLWVGTSGVLKFARRGLTSFNAPEGLRETNIQSIREGVDKTVYFVHGIDWRISKITENGIETAKFRLPESTKMLWTSNAAIIDENNNWWALAENGLYRFSANSDLKSLSNQNPLKVYGTEDGLIGNAFYCAFKDSAGNIWFSTRSNPESSGLTRYNPKTNEFRNFTEADGFPKGQSPVSFTEDKAGNFWFGLYRGGLVRYSNEHFTDFSKAENLPTGSIFGLYADEKGRLWVGSSQDGIVRIDDPSAKALTFIKYTTNEGLISNNVRTLTGDLQGNIYAGTVRGISRISPEIGNIRHYTTADGLAADFVTTSFRDHKGTLWFGTANGISKLEPQAEPQVNHPPEIWISSLNIAGTHYAVSEFGQKEVAEISVGSDQNNLRIGFLSVGNANRYQYKLEGVENSEWSSLSEQRIVNFANLAPDSYRFLVRAVNEYGQASENPAAVSFTINPPFWKTGWFITSIILLVGLAVFSLDRYRVHKTRQVQTAYNELQKSEHERRQTEAALQKSREERLAELERVRTRIATDLHDDIGSSLTQIAVLSSVAKESEKHSISFDESLENILEVSNELVEAMSDIVWAINPRKDNLRDLVQRMRRFAADIFTAKHIKFQFAAPDLETNVRFGANIRREIFSIFKESVNNAGKHSDCRNAKVEFRIENDEIFLQIADDGKGFNMAEFFSESLSQSKGGNGLLNIQRRTEELGGTCEIISEEKQGTVIKIKIPLEPREPDSDIHTSQIAGEIPGKIE